jgi:hypothetical protein
MEELILALRLIDTLVKVANLVARVTNYLLKSSKSKRKVVKRKTAGGSGCDLISGQLLGP